MAPTVRIGPPGRAICSATCIMNPSSTEAAPGAPLALRATTQVVSTLPLGCVRALARVGGFAHYWLARDKRRDRRGNFSQLAGKYEPAHLQAFQNHALNIVEMLRAGSDRGDHLIAGMALQGRQHIESGLRRGRGLILTTMHSGNWELAGLFLARSGYPVTTVAGVQLRRDWSGPVKAAKARYGLRVVSPRDNMRSLCRDLRANRVVVLHVDGDVFQGGTPASLLGRTVVVPRGPARLARMMAAPSAFAYCRRLSGDRLIVTVETPHDPPRDLDEERRLTGRFVGRLEKCILDEPGQWCIFRKL